MSIYAHLPLGKQTPYSGLYDATLLQAVPRRLQRQLIGLMGDPLPFQGEDIWTLYELSWLNDRYLPQVAIGELRIDAATPRIIESKSLKLYLNSFNQTCFSSWQEVTDRLQHDLSQCAGGTVQITLRALPAAEALLATLEGRCLDDHCLIVDPHEQTPNPDLLSTATPAPTVEEQLVSHLFKSNCPVTQQPDWASLQIHYVGPKIEEQALLRYLLSFRLHNSFHEQCVEQIFCDIQRRCGSECLSVLARYTRRGGIDINPFRSNWQAAPANRRLIRQ